MRKLLILIFGVLVGLPAISQTKLAEVTRLWTTKHITVSDGFIYKYLAHLKNDTALYYQTGIDTFEVTVSFKKYVKSQPLPDIISTIDDNTISQAQVYNPATNLGDNVFNPSAVWSHMKGQAWNANHYNQTLSVVEAPGAYVEITFTGYKIEWYSEKRENHGIASISIDSGTPIDVDLYAASTANISSIVWTSPNLTNATHKVRVSYTGRKNSASISANITSDRFVIYAKQ